jgi:tellurite resistance protein TehA-like permease
VAISDQEEAFENILSTNLQRVVDFLKYAEAKNGALLTFSSAWVIAIIGLISSEKRMSEGLSAALSISLPLLIGAGALAIISFYPRIHLAWFLGGKRAGPHPKNFLYFGDIASMTASEFQKGIRERYHALEGRAMTDEYVHDLTVQIYVNSQIARRKLRLFSWGLALIAAALVFSCFQAVSSFAHKL